MLESILIRKATEKDLGKICDFYLKTIQEVGNKSCYDLTENVLSNLNSFFVAESEGMLVGQAALVPHHFIQYVSHDNRIVSRFNNFLCNVYVSPEYRKNQIGSEIIGEIESKNSGSKTNVIYSCGESESGRRFLEKNGYINIGKECRCCEVRNKECEHIPMYIKHLK